MEVQNCENIQNLELFCFDPSQVILVPFFLHLRDVYLKCTSTLKSLQPVEVCVPYRRKKRREVVVQRFDGQSWSTLPTVLRRGSESHSSHPGGRPARVKYKTSHCKIILLQLYSSFIFVLVVQIINLVLKNDLLIHL